MIRGFAAGILWGGLVAVTGLVVVSQVAPPSAAPQSGEVAAPEPVAVAVDADPSAVAGLAPDAAPDAVIKPALDPAAELPAAAPAETVSIAAAEPASEPPALAAPEAAAPAASIAAPDVPDPAPIVGADPTPQAPASDITLPTGSAAPKPALSEIETAPTAPSEPNPTPGTGPDALLELAPPAATEIAPAAPQTEGTTNFAATPVAPDAPAGESAPAADGSPAPPPGDPAAVIPGPADLGPTDLGQADPEPANPEPADSVPADSEPAVPEPAVPEPAEPTPRLLADDHPDTLPSAGTIGNRAEGVKTGRLPSVGSAPTAEPAPDSTLVAMPPLQRFARPFDGGDGRPLFVILLNDIGAAGMARDQLTRLPLPVSFVIDPAAPDAAAAVAAYRAAGQEVLILANGIPAGAQPSDLEQTFQALAVALPETVAVVDLPQGGFQDDRELASYIVPILKEQGRGMVTYDQGLNAADDVARREGVASVTIFRRLDGAGETVPLVRRLLDRAAFRAAQEGQVVVIGDTSAGTVAAILEWTVEGRAAAVTLAPVTSVLRAE